MDGPSKVEIVLGHKNKEPWVLMGQMQKLREFHSLLSLKSGLS